MFEYSHEGIYFRCHEENDGDRELQIDNQTEFLPSNYFSYYENVSNPYDSRRVDVAFHPTVKQICFRIFDVIKKGDYQLSSPKI